jgi:hypothetical protein
VVPLLAAFAPSPRRAAPAGIAVAQWQPHDFSFPAKIAADENPFLVGLSATVTGPGGVRFTIPGFYDGDGVWKVRVTPNATGSWSLTTTSARAELADRPAQFTCVPNRNPRVHGALRVDRDHPRHFIFEDGTRFFLQSYECDWLWALDLGQSDLRTTERFLNKISAQGFNHVILNAYAHDTSWRRGTTAPDDFGPPKLHAWKGTNEAPDHQRFNVAYWRHYDAVIAAMHGRGIQAHVLMKVLNKRVTWPERGSKEDALYFRWLIARYGAYPNVIWDLVKEAHNERNLDYKLDRMRFIRAHDGHRRLLTIHGDDKNVDSGIYDEWLDFRNDQGNPRDYHKVILRNHARREWPVLNSESDYEWGPGGPEDKTYRNVQSPEQVIGTAWEIAMAGGYVTYYYTYTAWDIIRPDDTPPGYAYFRHFGAFFRRTQYWRLKSNDSLVSVGYCLAEPGREYVAFQPKPQPFTLDLEGAKAPLAAYWFHPYTGRTVPAGQLSGHASVTPPADWKPDDPIVLHVGGSPPR